MWAAGVSNAGYTGGARQDFARSIYANEAPPQGAGKLTPLLTTPVRLVRASACLHPGGGALTKYPGYHESGRHARRGRFIAPTADLSAHENPPTYLPNRLRLSHGRQLAASHIIDETADLYILWNER